MIARVFSHWRNLSPRTRRLAVGLAAGAGMAIVSALVAGSLDTYLDVRAPSMTFLCSVILAAIWFGRSVGLATAFFAFFVYNFYLAEPRNAFKFAGLEDVLTLLVFVGVALLIGGLTGTLHDERERAKEHARIFSGLFAVSRTMVESGDADQAMRLLCAGVREIAAERAVIFRSGEGGSPELSHRAPQDAHAPESVRAAAIALLERGASRPDDPEEVSGWRLQVVPAGGERATALAWRPAANARSAEHAIAVRLLAELTGVVMQRTQYLQRQLEMETLEATDRLRTALMSSISHDFRTPLSTILTSASSLQAYGDQFSAATRADLLTSIQEEAERLNRFVRNILDMTRLEAGVVQPSEEWIDPLEALDNVGERMQKRLGDRKLTIDAPAAVPAIFVDPLLLEQAIVNVIENALVHTPASSAIRIGADYGDHAVRLWVEDEGPGVPASELTHIFDKFHRVQNPQNTQGAGLGLAISKGFVEAMQGEIKAASPAHDGRGLKVEFTFPLQAALAGA
jgi:two-component system sensor histidine kinase KdpD